jgi:aspartate/methionine/tyrosine aminotransferase
MRNGMTHYSSTRGLPELRSAIADKLRSVNHLSYDPDQEILVTHGGIHAVYCAINALANPGDEVLIFDPCWMPYVSATTIAGGRPVRIQTDPQDGFAITAHQLEAHLTHRSRIVILNSPCNPSGHMIAPEQLREIAEIVERHNLLVISDEVYESLTYDGHEHVSFASLPGMRDRTITINSFSKTYAMSGWRIGYLAADARWTDLILKLSQYSITNVAPFTQQAAVTALTDSRVASFVEESRKIYASRRRQALASLRSIEGIRVVEPQGAFYFVIDISNHCHDSARFALELLEQQHVAVVPGIAFGACTEGTIRMTFAASDGDILEGIDRLKRMSIFQRAA